MEAPAVVCRKCSAPMEPGEEFCSACGAVRSLVPDADAPPQVVNLYAESHAEAVGKARKWLMIIAIVTLVVGAIMYVIQSGEVEKTIRQLDEQTAGMSAPERDALMQEHTGMTYQQVLDHDRGMVKLLLFVNIGLAAFYLGMWFWAKRNVLAASVIALLMFVSVTAVNGVLEPSTLYKGIILKVFFVLALAKAIQLAMQERAAKRA